MCWSNDDTDCWQLDEITMADVHNHQVYVLGEMPSFEMGAKQETVRRSAVNYRTLEPKPSDPPIKVE